MQATNAASGAQHLAAAPTNSRLQNPAQVAAMVAVDTGMPSWLYNALGCGHAEETHMTASAKPMSPRTEPTWWTSMPLCGSHGLMEPVPTANGIRHRQSSPYPTYGKGGTVPRPTRCNEHVDPVWCVVGNHNFPAIAFPISSTDIVDTSHHECRDTEAIRCSLAGHPCAVFCASMCLTFAFCPSFGGTPPETCL